jgi:hypothetical protein
MTIFYVQEAILSSAEQPGVKEWISRQRGYDGSFIVESSHTLQSRTITVFAQPSDARKSFLKEKEECSDVSGFAERVNLWEVQALTQKGAAKKTLKRNGTLIETVQSSLEVLKKKRASELMGAAMLSAHEAGS